MSETNGNNSNSLSAENLQKTYGRRRVVDDVSLFVEKGEIVGLLGANGAGKTTTFYMMTGLERTENGKIFLSGQDVTNLPMYLRARLGLGYLPQEPSIFRRMSAEQNILAVLETLKISRQKRFERLEELLEEFHITHVRKTRGDSLSGGER
ncbi:MAG: ATP-binding cassette domain-containing protein, partial [Pyrinomonadaceae bacterium]|nr:ATP-binding cassette domain-containing protein [Pyrinomonadaceae bacterium]